MSRSSATRRIHPVQYLLVGFAVTLFYLLLLAFAEYMPFDGAYGLAAVAILALVTLYARAVFGGWRLAGLVGGLLALFYGYFYVLLQQEQYALLLGSLGLLVTLAAVMYLSRRVDWYAGGLQTPRPMHPVALFRTRHRHRAAALHPAPAWPGRRRLMRPGTPRPRACPGAGSTAGSNPLSGGRGRRIGGTMRTATSPESGTPVAESGAAPSTSGSGRSISCPASARPSRRTLRRRSATR